MITLIVFLCLFIGIFGKLISLAVKMTWGITKILLNIVFLPLVLIVLAVKGLFIIAIPALVIIGIITVGKAVLA